MATIENVKFTYPILCDFNDDYKDVDFFAGIYDKSVSQTRKSTKFEVLISINNKKIIDMINNDDLKVLLKIYCSNTKYRNTFTLKIGINEVIIDNKDINKRVEVTTLIVANKDIFNYNNESFNDDYNGKYFNIKKGNIFAIGKYQSLYIEKDINEFTKINSVITIVKADGDNYEPVNYEGDKIRITINKDSFSIYEMYAKFSNAIVNSMIIVPALMYVLDSLIDVDITEYEDKKWYRVLSKKCSEVIKQDFSIDYIKQRGSLELVQKLFDNPLNEGLIELKKLYEQRGDK